MKHIIQLIGVIIWIAGIVIANGFWSTFFAIFIPLWAWYLVIERVLVTNGII
jgi:hypothetical protein